MKAEIDHKMAAAVPYITEQDPRQRKEGPRKRTGILFKSLIREELFPGIP